jgi:type II secretory pathway component GspD/PulD (secretin)
MKALSVKHRVVAAALLLGVIALTTAAQSDVAEVNAIRIEQTGTSTKYLIEQTGSADFQDFLLKNPDRLVVDLVGARHALEKTSYDGDGKLVRGVRTSQFRSEPNEVTRLVFDIAEGTRYKVAKNGTTVEVSFFAADGASVPAATPKTAPDEGEVTRQVPKETKTEPAGQGTMKASFGSAWDEGAADIQPRIERKNEDSWTAPETSAPVATSSPAARPAADQPNRVPAGTQGSGVTMARTVVPQDQQKEKWTHRDPSKGQTDLIMRDNVTGETSFTTSGTMMSNKKITMDVQGADIKTVLRSISEFSGANIVAGIGVEGPVTIHLVEVPWREALDVILKANGYDIREEYGLLRVGTMDNLNDEELDAAQLAKQKEDLEPMVTRVVKLNYVNAKELKTAMKSVNTKRGMTEAERDNNAIIINDIPRVANRIAEMAVNLDTRISQVEITAKMVDVDVEVIRELGVQWQALNLMSTDVNAAADLLSGEALVDPFERFRVGTIQSWGELMFTLEALERDNKANIISNPRITTTDNREATILVGKEIPLIVADEAGNAVTELKKIGVTLRCTPHVNSDMTITMDLHPEISELSSQATVQGGVIISLQESDTRVIVRDGETAVIGGLIQEVETEIRNGIPVLKDVPVLGGLFRFENKTKKKRELIIFVTPRVVGEVAETSGDMSMH